MNEWTDQQLLRDYAGHRSEGAFAELVRRHLDLVYSAALRMVCDSHLAQDVTQNTFVALALNARPLTNRPVLSGWLHRTAQNLASKAVRTDVRRRAREQEAAAMNELLSAGSDVSWEHIAPHLDAALGELSEPDRDAVLLRYFEKKSAQEMAERLGISDEAAQKRVSRAVERLREFFTKRGVTIGASGLVVVISANAVQAAPVGLAVTISTAATIAGTTLTTTATATTAKVIAMTTLQKSLIAAMLVAAVGTGIYEARQAARLRDQVKSLQQPAPLAEQNQQLQRERDDATSKLTSLREDNERLSRNTAELLRLRGEVGVLRHQTNELGKLHEQNLPPRPAATEQVQPTSQIMELSAAKDLNVRLWLEAFFAYARKNQGQCPETFEQAASFLPESARGIPAEFEILYHGSLAAIKDQDVIVFREKQLWQHVGGKWGRYYGIANGHAQYSSSSDKTATGNFDDYEKGHLAQSPSQ